MITIRGGDGEDWHPIPGCYIAGHHGQYGIDMMADVIEQFDWEFGTVNAPDIWDDPRFWRRAADAETPEDAVLKPGLHDGKYFSPTECWEMHDAAADALETFLNEHTDGGYWSWEDGEFFLTQTEANGKIYVIADDYEEAWEYLRDGVEGAIYADRYQACELAEDAAYGEGEKVYEFQATYYYIVPEGHEGIDPRKGVSK